MEDYEDLRQGHATYYLTLVEATRPDVTDLAEGGALTRLEREPDNLREPPWNGLLAGPLMRRAAHNPGLRCGATGASTVM